MWSFLIVLVTVSGMTIDHTPTPVATEQACNTMRDEIKALLEQRTWRTFYIGPCAPLHPIEVL